MSTPLAIAAPNIQLLSKIHLMMGKVAYIQKDAENKEQRYKYLSYEAVSEKIQPALIDLKLVAIPEFESVSEKEYSTAKGALWKYVKTKLTLKIYDVESGEFLVAIGEGSGVDPGDKAVAKAQTMAQKNLWTKLLNIPIGDDPEADPQTDKQQFMMAQPQQTYYSLPTGGYQLYGFPYYEQEIVANMSAVWGHLQGFEIPHYIQQRFQRPPNLLSGDECFALKNEFASYAQQKSGGQ
ncbi:ERF family protein [Anaerospora hongkongensis]|uniref:ERF family protein n=1 Tax=Anaerospora hongkongensis TaxID=244830 RepID=UPI002FDA6C9E